MNKREESLLLRVYSALEAIPLPIMGAATQSATVFGFVTFGKDMGQAKRAILSALHYIRIGEFADAEELLDALERWIELRKGQDWGDIFPFPILEGAY